MSMMTELEPHEQAHVWAVFLHQEDATRWRYVPKWQSDGSWRVWDRREQQELNAQQLFKVPLAQIKDEQFLS